MKKLILVLTLLGSPALYAQAGDVIEIGVSGLTCPFCVDGLDRNLEKLDGVSNADVSLKNNKARIIMKPGVKANIKAIKAAIIDAGFTPSDVIKK